MVSTEIKNIVEALIFASEDEITTRQIKEITDSSGVRISVKDIESSIDSLNDDYRTFNKSFEIVKIAGGYSFSTKKEYGRFVGKLFEEKQKKKLSQSALETLSIIAYKQPITRNEIEFVRGVNVDYIVNSLLERDLVKIHGRADTPGRPILYATTNTFLKVLGLNSLEDLPKLKEINEILKNQEIEGITEADIELFNSVHDPGMNETKETGQLELITSDDFENNSTGNIDSSDSDDVAQSNNTDSSESGYAIIEEIEKQENLVLPDSSHDDTEKNDEEVSNYQTEKPNEDNIINEGEEGIDNIERNELTEKDDFNSNDDTDNENNFLTKEGEEDSL